MSAVATPSRRHRSVITSGTRRLPRARTLATLASVNPIRGWDSPRFPVLATVVERQGHVAGVIADVPGLHVEDRGAY